MNAQQKIQNAIKLIEENTQKMHSLTELASVVGLSKYHFLRIFKATLGISPKQFQSLVQLKNASIKLALRKELTLINIAFDEGFKNYETFQRLFKRYYDLSPKAFRNTPDWQQWHQLLTDIDKHRWQIQELKKTMKNDDVTIVDFPKTPIAAYEHRGDPSTIFQSVQQFIAWRKKFGTPPSKSSTFNILIDDPESVESSEFRMDIACTLQRPFTSDNPAIVAKTMPAMRCAKLRHVGPDNRLRAPIDYLLSTWLTNNNETPGDFPLFLQRVSFYPEVPEHEMISDVYLPLHQH